MLLHRKALLSDSMNDKIRVFIGNKAIVQRPLKPLGWRWPGSSLDRDDDGRTTTMDTEQGSSQKRRFHDLSCGKVYAGCVNNVVEEEPVEDELLTFEWPTSSKLAIADGVKRCGDMACSATDVTKKAKSYAEAAAAAATTDEAAVAVAVATVNTDVQQGPRAYSFNLEDYIPMDGSVQCPMCYEAVHSDLLDGHLQLYHDVV